MILYDADITRLKTLEAFILQHLQDDLSISALCEQFAISKARLQRQFRQYYTMPVHHFILMKRMHHARLLLSTKAYSITDVAFTVGYRDRSSFTRAYTRYYHQSPTMQLKAPATDAACIPDSRL